MRKYDRIIKSSGYTAMIKSSESVKSVLVLYPTNAGNLGSRFHIMSPEF